jgi:hypothetical protein
MRCAACGGNSVVLGGALTRLFLNRLTGSDRQPQQHDDRFGGPIAAWGIVRFRRDRSRVDGHTRAELLFSDSLSRRYMPAYRL